MACVATTSKIGNRMATKKEKQQLIETLKFIPCTYRIELSSYGGEAYAGRVPRSIYEYFKQQDIDLEAVADDWSNDLQIPDDRLPFPPGLAHECDNLGHASGATLDDSNTVKVFDQHEQLVWSCSLDMDDLTSVGVTVEQYESFDFDSLQPEEVAIWGASGEKGLLFGGEIEMTAPFDPARLKITYIDADGWYLSDGIEYAGEHIDNTDYSTSGRWTEHRWVLGNDEEEVYTPSTTNECLDAQLPASYWPQASEELEFPFPEYKPVRPGWYACFWKESSGTGGGKLYWDGDKFCDVGRDAVYQWTGLNWDTTSWANCPQAFEEQE